MGGRIMLTVVLVLVACILILGGILLLLSPGKPVPFKDKNGRPLAGSISEKIRININGSELGMFIKGKDVNNPVMLFLHGGLPEYFLTRQYPTGLEDHFTMAWWEERGSGLSYHPGTPQDSLTLELMISDAIAVTNYLRARFGQEKIYLMAHSGGTFIGIQVAEREPGLYHAYIGTAQMTQQLRSELLAYEYMLEQYKEKGNRKMVRKLEAAPVTMTGGIPARYLALRDRAMHPLGIGTTHDMNSVITGIILPSFTFREYTLAEKLNLWRGKANAGVSNLWKEILAVNLAEQVTKLEIPVYFFHGAYDMTVSYTLAREYFDKLQAPLKGFYTFDNSAHSPIFEGPGKALQIMVGDVMGGRNDLADIR